MGNPRELFEPNTIYHLYNHGNGDDLIFREKENYSFFLNRFKTYTYSVALVYAYCLMPNHFHFLIRIKDEKELVNYFMEKYPDLERSAMSHKDIADLVSRQFRSFLISYSKSFNKMYDRRGSLFLDNIKRISIRNDDYFTNMIRYIHFNPVLHGFAEKPYQWKFSSIHAYQSEKKSLVRRREVIEWFGGISGFQQFHQSIQKDEFENMNHLILE